MSKRAPSTTQLLVIAGFALSCFGILLFLWITFGGPTPFKAKSYEIKVPFNEATQLAQQSDVRISGVNVGKVQSIELAPNGKQALATVDIDDKYAPLPEATRGRSCAPRRCSARPTSNSPRATRDGPKLDDGGTLPEANIAESVQLDEIFRTFDAADPRRLPGTGCRKRRSRSTARARTSPTRFGELEPTFTEFDNLFRILDSQRLAVRQLFRNGATTFDALRGREGELADLIQNSNAVFQTTAAARPRHRSALPRLPDLPGRVAADPRPAQRASRSTPTR